MDKPTGVSFLNIFRSLSQKVGSLFQKDIYVALSYFFLYSILLFGIARGIGQYWDWSFPYFSDQVKNVFWSYAFSWLGSDTGAPLPYMSDYYVRILLSLFGFLPPEIFRYLLVVLLLSLISFGTYRILKKTITDQSKYLMFVSGLAVSINPTIFYKLLAGHVNYLISLTVFVYLMYFMLFVFQNTKRRYGVILGLFFAFIGAQIQFFTFALIFLCIIVLLHKEKRSIQSLFFVIVISFLINLPWLSNFLVGVVQVSDLSQLAAVSTSKEMSFSSVADVLYMTFSKATLIDKFYNPLVLQSFSSLFILLIFFICTRRGGYKDNRYVFLYTAITLLVLEFSIPLLTNFYYGQVLAPIFRESGHFGPIIILLLILSLSSWTLQKREQLLLAILFTVFVSANIPMFVSKLPYVNFKSVREKFIPFKQKLESDNTTYRILGYPFFSPYRFISQSQEGGVIPLNNAGNDSFVSFSGKGVSNLVRPYVLETSPQYAFKKTYDLNVLKPYNIKYIFDFSNIYSSEYSRYLPSKIAKENVGIIVNDKDFLKIISGMYPEEMVEESPGIYKLLKNSGNVFGFSSMYCYKGGDKNFSTQMYRVFNNYVYSTNTNCNNDAFVGVVNFTKMLKDKKLTDKFVEGALLNSDNLYMYTAAETKEYYVKNTGGFLNLYIKENKDLGKSKESVMQKIPLDSKDTRYFIEVRDKILQIPENIEVYIGTKTDTPKFNLLKENILKVDLDKVNTFDFDTNLRYIISFDYKGKKGSYLSYTISDTDEYNKRKISDSVLLTDNNWNNYVKVYNPLVIGKQNGLFQINFKNMSGLEYANKKISTLDVFDTISLETEFGYAEELVNKNDVLKMIYSFASHYDENLISNGGFEDGDWGEAAVCHKNGQDDIFSESEVTKLDKTEGENALILKSKGNVTCVKKSISVKAGNSYNLSFDYKGDLGGVASYRIDFNNVKSDQLRDSVDVTPTEWNSYQKEIQVPAGATNATLYLFSRGSELPGTTTNLYDNVYFRRVLYPDNSIYLTEAKENEDINKKIEVWYKEINPTKTDVVVVKATNPFYLGFSETYHPDWKVRPGVTKGGISANPMYTDGVLSEDHHYRVNEYLNAWYIDPVAFCKKDPQTCTIESDGTYTIKLTIEFWPQRWFVIFLGISFITLFICVLSLIHAFQLNHINYLSLFSKKSKDIL